MKTIFVFLAYLSVASFVNAQDVKLPTGSSGINTGKLLTQFAGAIQPSAFLDGSDGNKNDLMGKMQNAASAAQIGGTVASLAGLIKPAMFKQGISAQSILKTANTVKTMSDVAGLLKSFEGGLKPEALTSGWSGQRGDWLKALSLLK